MRVEAEGAATRVVSNLGVLLGSSIKVGGLWEVSSPVVNGTIGGRDADWSWQVRERLIRARADPTYQWLFGR